VRSATTGWLCRGCAGGLRRIEETVLPFRRMNGEALILNDNQYHSQEISLHAGGLPRKQTGSLVKLKACLVISSVNANPLQYPDARNL
jgi:hypothetical protein